MRRVGGIAAIASSIWVVMLAEVPTSVQAYCPTECKRFDPRQGYCVEYGPVGAGCTTSPSGPSRSSGSGRSYGAIAYSEDSGDIGSSQGYSNHTDAEARAKKECGKSDCKTAVWYYNSCGGLAKGDNGSWGWDHGDDQRRAGQAALTQCVKADGKNCKVIASYCSR